MSTFEKHNNKKNLSAKKKNKQTNKIRYEKTKKIVPYKQNSDCFREANEYAFLLVWTLFASGNYILIWFVHLCSSLWCSTSANALTLRHNVCCVCAAC